MRIIAILLFSVVFLSTTACKSNKTTDDKVTNDKVTNDKNTQKPINLADGSIDGYVLTLGFLSDLLDEDLTIERAKELLGKLPLILEDGDSTELRYAVYSDDLYQNGMRITTISITFKNGVLSHSSVNFTGYYD